MLDSLPQFSLGSLSPSEFSHSFQSPSDFLLPFIFQSLLLFAFSFTLWTWANLGSLFWVAHNHNLMSSFNNPEIFSPPNSRSLKQEVWVSFWVCKDGHNLKWTAEQGALGQTFARQWARCGGEDKRLAAQPQQHTGHTGILAVQKTSTATCLLIFEQKLWMKARAAAGKVFFQAALFRQWKRVATDWRRGGDLWLSCSPRPVHRASAHISAQNANPDLWWHLVISSLEMYHSWVKANDLWFWTLSVWRNVWKCMGNPFLLRCASCRSLCRLPTCTYYYYCGGGTGALQNWFSRGDISFFKKLYFANLLLIDSYWCWLMLIDAVWYWLIIVDSHWCWLMLVDAD